MVRPSNVRYVVTILVLAAGFLAGVNSIFGDGPRLSIIRSNENVILTWPQTGGNWHVVEMPIVGSYCYESNGDQYCEIAARRILTRNPNTNGTNLFVVLPLVASENRFYVLQTNGVQM